MGHPLAALHPLGVRDLAPRRSPALRRRIAGVFASILALFALLWPCAGGAQGGAWETGADGLLPIPPLKARVTDLTHTLSPAEQQALEAKLADWEARTTNQLAV